MNDQQREIKFRGKRLDNAEWISGDLVHHGDRVAIGERFVYPSTVGQYTGLKDKHGVEIYEGDVVKTPSWPNDHQVSEVFFKAGSYAIYLDGTTLYESDDEKGRGWIEISQYSSEPSEDFEVIGNIYENPELLES